MSGTAPVLEFRPLQRADLPLLLRWRRAPHVQRWFGPDGGLAELERDYAAQFAAKAPPCAFVAELDARPVAMLEWARFGEYPEIRRAFAIQDSNTVNCDVLIGEQDSTLQGLGPTLIRQFLERIVFVDPELHTCVIDPEPDNSIAIRAYEKAGFRFLRAVPEDSEGHAAYLMQLTRAELANPTRTASVYIRPARESELDVATEIDDDAGALFADIGVPFDFDKDHPFVVAERERFAHAARAQRLLFACSPTGEPIAFAAFGLVDARPFLFQLAVRRAWTRRGVGTLLLQRAVAWSVRAQELWLTTYRHVSWNGPWYTRLGFAEQPLLQLGPELRALSDAERASLPVGEQRIVMRLAHSDWSW